MSYKKRILIIDDISENIQIAMNILKEEDYLFSFATDGITALDLINDESSHFDLLLLDVMMPEMDGYAVCKQLKENPETRDIPVIFLTAKTDIDSIRKGFSLGGVDFISKPFHAEELQARVRTHIDLYSARRLLQENNIALRTKLRFERSRLMTELEENQKEMIYMLTELMEFASDETGKHIRRVAELCSLLAHYHPSLTSEDEEILFHASPMHDIGKMMIPHEILHKPGKYTPEEFTVMKAHTTNAFEMLRHSERKLMKAAAIIAHEHHEMWNGEGYPRSLKAEQIHIYGRIVALADVFDALTHARCYKDAWDIKDAIDYIKELKGKQFDPQLVEILLANLDEFIAIIDIE